MKKNLFWMGIFIVLVFGMTMFIGCAEKKAVVKSGAAQEQQVAPAPAAKADTAQEDADRLAREKAEREAALRAQAEKERAEREQAAKMQAAAPVEVNVKDINFDFDKFNIRPDAREILKANADYFLKSGVAAIVIEGNCDARGTAEYNMALGQRRAREAKKYLVNLGVKESIMKTISYGKEQPLDPGDNEEAWAKNRRDHFVIKNK
jgi:peptidoglycan-associated lipoprotein